MPKENIYDERKDVPVIAEVRWHGSVDEPAWVQLGVVNPDSPFRWEMLGPDTGGVFDGWQLSLDRAGINRLIRALRKARDAAYGSDA